MSAPVEDLELGTLPASPAILQQPLPPDSPTDTAQPLPEEPVNRESMSRWLPKSWSRRVPPKDEFETYIQQKSSDAEIARLARDYSRIKGFSLKRDVSNAFFSLGIFPQSGDETPSDPWALVMEDEDLPFRTYINTFYSQLKNEEGSRVLRTCVVCCQTPASLMPLPALYSFRWKSFASATRLRQRSNTPWLCILHAIAERWGISTSILESCLRIGEPLDPKLVPFTKLCPGTGAGPVKPDSSSGEWISIELQWFASAPQYRRDYKSHPWLRDYKIYVWQPQIDANAFPPQKARILLSSLAKNTINMVILLRPSLEKAEVLPVLYQKERHRSITAQTNDPPSRKVEVVHSIFSLYNIMLMDTRNFLREILDQIAILRVEGRHHPTVGKINFVLHLDDVRQGSMIGLRDAKRMLSDFSALANDDDDLYGADDRPRVHQPWLEDIGQQMESFELEFSEIGKQLGDLKLMIKEQIDLQQNGLTAILTILAVIYVPFSFVSSVFGMNLSDPLWTHSPGNLSASVTASSSTSQPTPSIGNMDLHPKLATSAFPSLTANATISSTAASSTADTSFSESQIDRIIAAITSARSGNHLWTFKSFWYTAVIATAITVLLPLFAGGTFRIILRFSYNHRQHAIIAVLVIIELILSLHLIIAAIK